MRVAVVGGGIAGLAAAHELAGRQGVDVAVLEAGGRLGGKLQTEPFAGLPVDTAADAFLARRPEAVQLCDELGLADRLVAPAHGSAYVWARGRLRRLPDGLVLGVPVELLPLARSGVLSPAGLARAAAEPLLPGRPLAPDEDEAVGHLLRRRLGDEAATRLVDPLIGGINAGDTDRLSIDAVAPQLAAAARRHRSLVVGARRLRDEAPPAPPGQPVFLALPEGMGALVDALAARLRTAGVDLRCDTPVEALERRPGGYRLATPVGPVDADAVVIAVPAFAAAPLLAPHAPAVAGVLEALTYASVTLVALAYPADAVRHPLDGSGFLVPRPEGRLMTACSWASSKWAHLAMPGQVVLRVSAGRAGDDRAAALPDTELVDRLRAELGDLLGVRTPPLDVRVSRWPDAFPQYAPGHLARIDRAGRRLAAEVPGVALAGAALGGVGIPACIGSGRAAARALLPA